LKKQEDDPNWSNAQEGNTASATGSAPISEAVLTGLPVAALPWVFTQNSPLTTGKVIQEAGRWGVSLDAKRLRALYRSGDFSPMLQVQARASRPPDHLHRDEPQAMGTTLLKLRAARREGRLIDPTLRPLPSLACVRGPDPQAPTRLVEWPYI
jgi:hypothetical protein